MQPLNRKVLITGGAGFIGSHLADALIEKKHEVVVIDDLSSGKKENINKKAKFYKLNILDKKISRIFCKEKPDIVFHYAARTSVTGSIKNPFDDAKNNILGSVNIFENCKNYKVGKVIFASSGGAIYGEAKIIPTNEYYPPRPLSPYGIAKLTAEKYLEYYNKAFNLPFVSLRFSNVYGPRQNFEGEAGVIAIFLKKMLSGVCPVIHGNGAQTRDFVFIKDVVAASITATRKDAGGFFNVGSGKEASINVLFDKLSAITEKKFIKKHDYNKISGQKRSCLDCSKIKRELGWKPRYSLDKGSIKTLSGFGLNKTR